MTRFRLLSAITLLSLLVVPGISLAFVDTEGLSESLKKIEESYSGDSGLGGLLQELKEAAEESGAAGAYLQFTHKGKPVTFWDVKKDEWFYSSVLALVELGIVSGMENAKGEIIGYKPGENVARPAALKMALLAAGVDTGACGTPSRADARGHWAELFVACAEKMDFGLGNKSLGEPATRAEVVHYVLRAFGVTVPDGSPPFADSKNHQYKNDIAYAYALEIISGDKNADGTEKGSFRPDDPINRAEVAKIVKLAIELL